MLADKNQTIARAYGVLREDGIAFRGLFIIDDKQVLRQVSSGLMQVIEAAGRSGLMQVIEATDRSVTSIFHLWCITNCGRGNYFVNISLCHMPVLMDRLLECLPNLRLNE